MAGDGVIRDLHRDARALVGVGGRQQWCWSLTAANHFLMNPQNCIVAAGPYCWSLHTKLIMIGGWECECGVVGW